MHVLLPGLACLPIVFMLIKKFKANPLLANEQGLTPLCLAAELGEEKLAEVSMGVVWFITGPLQVIKVSQYIVKEDLIDF